MDQAVNSLIKEFLSHPLFLFFVILGVIVIIYQIIRPFMSKKENSKKDIHENDDKICPECGGKLLLRNGKYGQFYGCSNYPKCKYTEKV